MSNVVPHTFLDAAALVGAHARRDGPTVSRILDEQDPGDLALALAQLLATAIRSPKQSLDEWVAYQIDRTLEAIADDEADDAAMRDEL